MHCELVNKDVLIDVWKEIRDERDKDKILKTVHKCSECYVEIPNTNGRKMFNYCQRMSDDKCLLKQF
ncbi:hypothetical protein [Desulfosporosinus sp. FKA]|uniref:hypothetical protein n=1 Tax=Desulfosporosinus sp. FKA TaxID=1969834 RepID=UPI000B49DB00|nr:hypothetical protein [Desulfosporosinus sp. FKA]